MTRIDESDGSLIMDSEWAPNNSDVKLVKKKDRKIIRYIVLKGSGIVEDYCGLVLEETRELIEALKNNPDITVIARGESFVSLPELIYTLQSPTRQLYRATMADIKELLHKRFESDDRYMREICNKMVNEEVKEK